MKSHKEVIEGLITKSADKSEKIGHTRSGKPIMSEFSHSAHKDFSKKDHHDAAGAHITKQYEHLDASRAHHDLGNEAVSAEHTEKYWHHAEQAGLHHKAYEKAKK